MGGRGMWGGGGEREIICLSQHCHHQNDSCIKMGSDESHFNGSVGSDGQSHRTVSTNHKQYKADKLHQTYHWNELDYLPRPTCHLDGTVPFLTKSCTTFEFTFRMNSVYSLPFLLPSHRFDVIIFLKL